MPATEILRVPGQADLFALHARNAEQYPCLLESRQLAPQTGRYSLLFAEGGPLRSCVLPEQVPELLAGLENTATAARPKPSTGEPPFLGGWCVFLSYEAALGLLPHLIPVPGVSEQGELPLIWARYFAGAVVVDHLDDCTWFVSESGRASEHQENVSHAGEAPMAANTALRFHPEPDERYLGAVQRAVEYILAGDIYQANLSRRWHGPAMSTRGMLEAYGRLRLHNRAGFAASIQDPALCLASASPERLFSRVDDWVETRPIAGTRPRGADPASDRALIDELMQHPKEQAEHIMLVDLERNDLGRICEAHTVEVNELLGLESYASVHHIVSNVRGHLRAGVGLAEQLGALFPGGTITGCPKIRCMQIISELEGRPRGAYTGSLGYLSNCGRADFNILIRTLVHQHGRVHFDAGAGIVADSDPDRELAETSAKAAGLMQALM